VTVCLPDQFQGVFRVSNGCPGQNGIRREDPLCDPIGFRLGLGDNLSVFGKWRFVCSVRIDVHRRRFVQIRNEALLLSVQRRRSQFLQGLFP
jgi:hypothetical protein